MIKKIKKNKLSGFTLVEILTVLFIFSVVSVTFYSVFSSGTKYIFESKSRLGALALANEKMEIIRNLEYDDIGTTEGEIEGDIPQNEEVIENERKFNVNTLVEYVDDPYDGTAYDDAIWFEDYKHVTVTVSWSQDVNSSPVKLVSRFAPHGIEKENPNDGILSINVFSKEPEGTAESLSGSTVHVVNSEIGLNTSKNTDEDGNATFMGSNIQDSIEKYEITLSKSGYETVSTYPPYPTSAFNPVDVHASVVTGLAQVNIANIFQNKLANLEIDTVDFLDRSISDVDFHIKGGKKIGTTIGSNDPVYNLDEDGKTDSDGKKAYNDISPGQYEIIPSLNGTNYELIEINPASPFNLISSSPQEAKIRLADKNATSILVTIIGTDSNPVEGASVQLKNDTLNYDITQTTPSNGKVFFPVSLDLFQAGIYNLKITASGYSDSDTNVTINEDELKIETVNLTAL